MENSSYAKDKRRLHDRFSFTKTVTLQFSLSDGGTFSQVVEVIDVAKDSLSCRLPLTDVVSSGTRVHVIFPDVKDPAPLPADVRSVVQAADFLRVGLQFAAKIPLEIIKSVQESAVDRRKKERRSLDDPNAGKREFERRGFWEGLTGKRFFSHHAWELRKNDVYFYMNPLQSATEGHVIADGQEMIMMSSNNYLGLTTHPKIKEAAKAAIDKYGAAPGASSMLGGTLDIHLQLEEALAKFKGVEAVVLFGSGYITNLTTLTTILAKGDSVFNDKLNHASLLDGSRLSGAEVVPYGHCDLPDLKRKLERCKSVNKLVVTDSVFSMDGDMAPIPEIWQICRQQKAALMIDDAHGSGVFGKTGRGSIEHFGMEGKVDILMGTLSKALGGIGGFIGGSKELIRILKNTARAFVFSSYFPASMCATTLAALEIVEDEPERRTRLWQNTERLRSGLKALGFELTNSISPIIPVIFPTEEETLQVTKFLRSNGIYASPVIFPAVKKNKTRIRLTCMASHTDEDIEKVLSAFKKARELSS